MPAETEREYGPLVATALQSLRESAGWFLAMGVALSIIGIVAILVPQLVTVATELLIGAVLAAAGIVQIAHALWARDWSGFFLALLAGFFYLVVGALLLTYPLPGVLALTLLVGALFLAAGAFRITMAFLLRPVAGWGWVLASGIVAIIIAFLILVNWPGTALWALGLLVGIELLSAGVGMIAAGLGARRLLA